MYLSCAINLGLPESWASRERVHSLVINKSYEPQILKDESRFNLVSTLLDDPHLGIKSCDFWTCWTPPSFHQPYHMLAPDFNGIQVEFIRRYSLVPSQTLGVTREVLTQVQESLAWTTGCLIGCVHTRSHITGFTEWPLVFSWAEVQIRIGLLPPLYRNIQHTEIYIQNA